VPSELRSDAGYKVMIQRNKQAGPIPAEGAKEVQSGTFSVAEVNLRDIIQAKNPDENIRILPHDVVSIPRGQLVYVVGEVEKAGGYVLSEQPTISVLQALSLAGGLSRLAQPQNARILRNESSGGTRQEIAVNIKHILSGKENDVPMRPEDILFIPNSASKQIATKAAATIVQTLTGILIFRAGNF